MALPLRELRPWSRNFAECLCRHLYTLRASRDCPLKYVFNPLVISSMYLDALSLSLCVYMMSISQVMQKYLHGPFVLRLIQLFQSQDLRERDYLKTILHRIYGRFMPLRQQIRTEIANECFRYVYGDHRMVHGIAEFLDIFSSIINGFSIPVKAEHKL